MLSTGPEPVPYDARGPVRDDHDLSYDERDGPDPYSQNVLGYNGNTSSIYNIQSLTCSTKN